VDGGSRGVMCVCKKSKTHCPRTELADIENGSVCRNILDCSVVCIRMRSSFSRTSTAGKASHVQVETTFSSGL
jgi:hypothetical protein